MIAKIKLPINKRKIEMTIVYFDIETLPCSDSSIISDMAKTITPPGNIKLAASIAKWHEENGVQALADMVSKTSFDGILGRIACISWAFDDEEPQTAANISEFNLLHEFYESLNDRLKVEYNGGSSSISAQFCGHNLAGFDLPFLKARSIILGVKPPSLLWKAMNCKPWDGVILDTMLMWNSDSQKRVSMDKLCRAFGIAGKCDFDGSMVAETWKTDPQKVIDYCQDDVQRTRQIYKRIIFQGK